MVSDPASDNGPSVTLPSCPLGGRGEGYPDPPEWDSDASEREGGLARSFLPNSLALLNFFNSLPRGYLTQNRPRDWRQVLIVPFGHGRQRPASLQT